MYPTLLVEMKNKFQTKLDRNFSDSIAKPQLIMQVISVFLFMLDMSKLIYH